MNEPTLLYMVQVRENIQRRAIERFNNALEDGRLAKYEKASGIKLEKIDNPKSKYEINSLKEAQALIKKMRNSGSSDPDEDVISVDELRRRAWSAIMPEKIRLKSGQIVEKPDDMSDSEFLTLVDKAFPPTHQMGESAAEDDVLGVSTAGIEMPTDYGRSQAVRSFAQVPTFGAGDEIESFFTGKPASDIRSEMERYNVESGGAGTAAEMLGGAYLPIGKAYQYSKAALGGLAYGTGKAEGDIGERLQEGAATAVTTPLFMLGANTFANIVSKPIKAAIEAYDQKMTKQSFDTLQNKLYKDLEMAGTIFSPQDTNRLTKQVRNSLESDFDWNPKTHKVANRVLNLIENRNLKKMSWSELDKLRQRMWNEYDTAKAKNLINETNYIREMIGELDEFVTVIQQQLRASKRLEKFTNKIKKRRH